MQGPTSLQVLELLGLPGELRYMSFVTGTGAHGGAEVTVCRTGYTGEHGYELLVDADRAGELWDAVLEAGQDLGIRPCGLGARDTLRTEMGYPLHGHELSLDITPEPGAQPAGRWAGRSRRSGAARRCVAEKEAGPGAAAVGPARRPAGASRARAWPSSTRTAPASARSPAARSRPTLRTGIALALIDAAAGVGGGRRAGRRRPRPTAGGGGREAAVRPLARALS